MPSNHFSRRKIEGEDAVDFFDQYGRCIFTVVDAETGSEWSPATRLTIHPRIDASQNVASLTADQVYELGRFCVEQFVGSSMSSALATIDANVACVREALESWNARARADEEHPPYDDLVRRLDEITAVMRGLEPLRRMK